MAWEERAIRALAGAATSVRGRRLTVLIFHRVLSSPDLLFPETITATEFERLVVFLKQSWEIIALDDAVCALAADALPARALAISFDDGYADNAQIAVPILVRHGVSATFFISTGFLEGGRMWNDTVIEAIRNAKVSELDLAHLGLGRLQLADQSSKRRAIELLLPRIKYLELGRRAEVVDELGKLAGGTLPDDLMMSHQQVREIRAMGMLVGAHTINHPILAMVPPHVARAEIVGGREALEVILGERITLFAYPNGKPDVDYLPAHVDMVRDAGFVAAVSTKAGVASTRSDPYQIPRFTPWDRSPFRFGLRLCGNLIRQG